MKVRLTAVTPLHIGGRESAVNPLEFVVEDKRCYVVSEGKLARALQEKDKLNDFSSWFAQTESPVLPDFLRNQKLLNEEFLQRIANYSSASPARIKKEIRLCIRDGFQRPFLPGTSIKGAIRTALLYGILENMAEPQLRKVLHDCVKSHLGEFDGDSRRKQPWFRERFKKEFARKIKIEEKIFQSFSLGNRRPGPNTDLLRCLRITDSTPLDTESARIETIKVFSARSKKDPKSLYVECLPEGSNCEFEITLDEKILEKFRKQNHTTQFGTNFPELETMLRDPLPAWKDMGHDLWRQDDCFFSREFNHETVQMPNTENQSLVRLGWGSGLLGTTVDMLLPKEGVQDIRNTLFVDRGKTPAPKTRRLVARKENTYLPLGWAKVEVVQK